MFIATPINLVDFTYFFLFFLLYQLRSALCRLKNYHEFSRSFLSQHLYRSRTLKEIILFSQVSEVSTIFFHFDGLSSYLHSFQTESAASFFKDDISSTRMLKQDLAINSIEYFLGPFSCKIFAAAKVSLILIWVSMIPGIVLFFHRSPIYMAAQEKNLKCKRLFPLCKTHFFLYEKRIKESPKFS